MSWVRIDDRFPHHPKVGKLGRARLAAMGLHLEALCYCSTYLTDGVVPAHEVRGFSRQLVQALVEAKLWHRLGDGDIQIHDYLEYNPSRDVVEGRRDSAKVRMNNSRTKREPDANTKRTASRGRDTGAQSPSRPVPVPTPETPPTPQDSANDPVVVYANLGGGWPSQKAMDWIDDLTGQYGAVAVIRAFGKAKGPTGKLIGAAQDVLRSEERELSLAEKTKEREKVAERRLDGMQSRRLDWFHNTGQWPADWGTRPAA